MITECKTGGSVNFKWIDIIDPDKDELLKIGADYGIHPALINDTLQPEHLPKYEQINNIWLFIVRAFDPGSNMLDEADTIQELTDKLSIFYTKDFLITVHKKEMDFLSALKEKYQKHENSCDSFQILAEIVNHALHSYDYPVTRLAREMDVYETRIFLRAKTPQLMKSFYILKRKAAVFHRMFILSRSIVTKLDSSEMPPNPLVEDVEDALVRMQATTEEVLEGVNHLLDIYMSLQSQRTNEVVRVLTLFSVFFMPLTFIVGIYGMNFDHMPELRQKWGYPAVLLLMGLISFLIYRWFKKKGWI